jgi:2,4-dienoyl-CoA reductase-like NADH-dependent reductase (Old Yellow Enzyme family)
VSAAVDRIPTEIMQEYYEAFARGQWGLIFTEGTYINESESQDHKNRPSIANDKHVREWSKIVDLVHKRNTPIFQKLIHAGALI